MGKFNGEEKQVNLNGELKNYLVSDLRPTFITDEHLEYLDDLREGGETNMFGAGSYLMKSFGLTSPVARDILMYWMKTFGNIRR